MKFGTPTALMWIAGVILELAILFALWYRGRVRQAPAFAAYTAWHLMLALGLYFVQSNYTVYFWGYWAGAMVGMMLAMAAVWEVYKSCLSRYSAIQQFTGLLFLSALAVLLAIAVVLALASPGSDASRAVAGVLAFERSFRVLLVGILLLLFALMSIFRLGWPHLAFGIALGFAIFNSVELAAVVIRAEVGEAAVRHFALLKPAAYTVALLVWTRYTLAADPAPAESSVSAEQLERWNRSLADFL